VLPVISCGSDSDGDGVPDTDDCAPEDAARYPGAVETPNDGIDSNCDGDDNPRDDGDDDDDAADDDDPAIFDSTETVTGDFSCVGNLPAVQAPQDDAVRLQILDFADDVLVYGAKVEIWSGNDPSAGTAAAYRVDDEDDGATDGAVELASGVLQSCSHFAVRVWTERDPQETYQTFQVNNSVIAPGFTDDLTSVSFATYNLISLALGLEPEPGKGIAAGKFTDCNGDPVEYGEASVGSLDLATGAVTEPADGYAVRYFDDEDPDSEQPHISADGLFAAVNVPPGAEQTLMTWGIPQDEAHCIKTTGGDTIWSDKNSAMCLLGYSAIVVQPDSVNIANVELRPYPAACYVTR
jgi:hypothetical protein